jgi:uncharacterized repeat protein (TIGR02543 family)
MKKRIVFGLMAILFTFAGLSTVTVRAENPIDTSFNFDIETKIGSFEAVVTHLGTKNYGDSVTIDAGTMNEDYEFALYIVNGKIEPTIPANHTFIVTSDLDITALYKPQSTVMVAFMDTNQDMLSVQYIASGTSAIPPSISTLSKPGLVVDNPAWNGNYSTVTEDTVVWVNYTPVNNDTFTVDVINGEADQEAYLFNEVATVSAGSENFQYWIKDGYIMSLNPTYSFTVAANISLTAVYDETASPDPDSLFVNIAFYSGLTPDRLTVMGQFVLPTGNTLIEYGLIASDTQGDITLNTAGVEKIRSNKYFAQTKEFVRSLAINYADKTIRAYMITSNGLTETITYSSVPFEASDLNYMILSDYDPLASIPLYPDETITSLSLGSAHSAALTSLGRVYTWGNNLYGRLGDGTTTQRNTPVEITSQFGLNEGESISSICLGGLHSSAISSSGRVLMWGHNDYGEIGDGTVINRLAPVDITSQFSLGVDETIISMSLAYSHSSAISSLGKVFTWGNNAFGRLGDGTEVNKSLPTEITSNFYLSEGDTIVHIYISGASSAALSSFGSVFTWGYNVYGKLGDGTEVKKSLPTEITSNFGLSVGETITNISIGENHSSAISSLNRVFMWGGNAHGQLGDGTTTPRLTPIEITNKFGLESGENIDRVVSGVNHSIALSSFNRVFSWGNNEYGGLGDGTTIQRNSPTDITEEFTLGAEEIINNIYIGNRFSSALSSEGSLFIWGYNSSGQLGDGTTTSRSTPAAISSPVPTSVHLETINYASGLVEYVPQREGYTFSGWYTDVNLTTLYIFTTMPGNNVTLYGRWNLIV